MAHKIQLLSYELWANRQTALEALPRFLAGGIDVIHYSSNGLHMGYMNVTPAPKVAIVLSDIFWPHKAKNIIQCFAQSVCVYVSVYYIDIVMQQKFFSVIYKLKYYRIFVEICFDFESVCRFVKCLCT